MLTDLIKNRTEGLAKYRAQAPHLPLGQKYHEQLLSAVSRAELDVNEHFYMLNMFVDSPEKLSQYYDDYALSMVENAQRHYRGFANYLMLLMKGAKGFNTEDLKQKTIEALCTLRPSDKVVNSIQKGLKNVPLKSFFVQLVAAADELEVERKSHSRFGKSSGLFGGLFRRDDKK